MRPPRWIIDLHEDFPGAARVAAHLQATRPADVVVIDPEQVQRGRWPEVEAPFVGYGTMSTMTRMRRVPALASAVFDDYARLRCSAYHRWTHDLLGRACVLAPFGALPGLPLTRMFGPRVFVRSDSNYKLFPAAVHEVTALPRWIDTYREHRDELVVVSEVVRFLSEYRCFCRDGAFVCGSSYPEAPWRPVPEAVARFAEVAAGRMLAAGTNLVTVDVGEGDDGALRVVEVGGVNSWGIYGADLTDFVAMMEAECLARADAG